MLRTRSGAFARVAAAASKRDPRPRRRADGLTARMGTSPFEVNTIAAPSSLPRTTYGSRARRMAATLFCHDGTTSHHDAISSRSAFALSVMRVFSGAEYV